VQETKIQVEPDRPGASFEAMDRPLQRRGGPARKAVSVVVVVMILGGLGYTLVFHESRSSLDVERDRLVISTVREGQFQELIPVNGTVIPIHMLFLNAVEGGRVEKIHREAGSMVEEGDAILELSNTDLLMDIMWREAETFQQSNSLRTSCNSPVSTSARRRWPRTD